MMKYASVILIVLIIAGCASENTDSDLKEQTIYFSQTVLSNNDKFEVTVATQNENSLSIGEYHNWVITLKTKMGQDVRAALFSINGGMPSHGHGLPTQPIVSQYLGSGKYLLEGMRFHMGGRWVVNIKIHANGLKDIAEFNFDVKY